MGTFLVIVAVCIFPGVTVWFYLGRHLQPLRWSDRRPCKLR
jgi:hypothetical protein